MGTAKAVLGSVLGRFIFRSCTVTRVDALSPRFRRIRLTGPALTGAAWQPGDKLQVFLPAVGTRAYTPLDWDEAQGATTLVVYLHGDAPGTTWARALVGGESVQVLGPRRSLARPGAPATVLFGDETSFGLAAALSRQEPARPVHAVLEVDDADEAATVLAALDVRATLIPRATADAHLADVQLRLREALRDHAGAALLMSGRAHAIQTLRSRLRKDGAAPAITTKAYWSLGKAGLD